jgi:hypothetical protein
MSPGSVHSVLSGFLSHGLLRKAELSCGKGDIAIGSLDRFSDGGFNHFGKGDRVVGGGGVRGVLRGGDGMGCVVNDLVWEMSEGNVGAIVEDDDFLDNVFEFADVTGPGIIEDGVAGFLGESGEHLFVPGGELFEEMYGQEEEVSGSFSKRRELDGDDHESVVEVFAEVTPEDFEEGVFVCGGDDADIRGKGFGVANALEGSVLEKSEEFGLQVRAHIADFVEEEGATVGGFAASDMTSDSACEGAFFVSEELAFEEFPGDGGAVDGDKGFFGPLAAGMDGACDEFLTGAALAGDKDGGIGFGDVGNGSINGLHLGADANHFVEAEAFRGWSAVGLFFQSVEDDCIANGNFEAWHVNGLIEEIEGPELHAFDSVVNGAIAGNDNDGDGFVGSADFLEKGNTIGVGEFNVQEDDAGAIVGYGGHDFGGCGTDLHAIAHVAEAPHQTGAGGGVVLNDENRVGFHDYSPYLARSRKREGGNTAGDWVQEMTAKGAPFLPRPRILMMWMISSVIVISILVILSPAGNSRRFCTITGVEESREHFAAWGGDEESTADSQPSPSKEVLNFLE